MESLKEFYGKGRDGELERGVYRTMDAVKRMGERKEVSGGGLELNITQEKLYTSSMKIYEPSNQTIYYHHME